MIEIMIKTKLEDALNIATFLEQPIDKPGKYLLIERKGMGEENHLGGSLFMFQSYAESMYEAALLNEEVKSAVKDLIIEDEIVSISLNTDYVFTDLTSKKYRYQAVFDIKHY